MLAPSRIIYVFLVVLAIDAANQNTTAAATASSPLTNETSLRPASQNSTARQDRDSENEVDTEYENFLRDLVAENAEPTFVPPVEKFLQSVLGPLMNQGRNEDQTGLSKIISGIAKPIRDIVQPVVGGRSFGEVLNLIGDRFKVIYPGTAWCGAGNVAENSQEVGLFEKTDRCCQAHDKCTMNMGAGQIDHGLLNNGMFTRSHCLCDANFYYCLKRVRSLISSNIGYTYFNLLRPQCFKLEYPAFCTRYGNTRLMNNKCLDYGYNYNQEKSWQWFDSPDFF